MSLLLPRPLHLADRPSTTAVAVTVSRALEAQRPLAERIVDDPYAAVLLPRAVRAALPALGRARPLLDTAEHNALTGLQTYVVCRHRFIDEHLQTALASDVEQVVVLGAGYDSRAYRFASALDGRPVFEVDLPPLSRLKARVVASRPATFGGVDVRRVEIDFRADSLASTLTAAGFGTGARTFVVWEGVAPYLTRAAVEQTLGDLRALTGPRSMLALDLWDGGGTGTLRPVRRLAARSFALLGEPVVDSVTPLAAAPLLGARGFDIADLAEGPELTTRYATAGRVAATSLYCVAAARS